MMAKNRYPLLSHPFTRMRKPTLKKALTHVGVLLLMISLCACSSVQKQTKKVVGALSFSGERLRKKVVILPFENTTFISDQEIGQLFMNRFTDLLANDCDNVLWVKPGDPGYPKALDRVPRLESGRVDNMTLLEMGRASGVNAFLLGNVASVDAEEKEKGFFIFRDTHYYESAQIGFQVYDTETGAKLLDESLKESVEVDGAEFDAIIAKDLKAMYELNQTLDRIAVDGAEKICETLGKTPWQGYVVAVQDGKIILSSGRETGMTAGDVLAVYRVGEVIEGKFGQRFMIPGALAGEIEITAVADGRAEARPLDEADVAVGCTVKLK